MIRRIFAVALVGLCMVAGVALPASAHTELESSSPADGSTVTDLSDGIVLTFNEPVLSEGAAISLTQGDMVIPLDAVTVEGAKVSAPVTQTLPAGQYTVAWRAVADDGHPQTGTFSFTLAPSPSPTETPSPTPSPSSSSPTPTSTSATASPTVSPSSSTSASPTSSDSTASAGSPLLPLLIGVLVLAAVVIGAVALARRRQDRP